MKVPARSQAPRLLLWFIRSPLTDPAGDPRLSRGFHVPDVIPELSSERVLTTEWVPGESIDKVALLPQEVSCPSRVWAMVFWLSKATCLPSHPEAWRAEQVRDSVATRLLALTLQELFHWQFMQTDPNWGNFLYHTESDK